MIVGFAFAFRNCTASVSQLNVPRLMKLHDPAGAIFPFGDDIHAFAGRLDTGYVIRLERVTTVTLLRSSRPLACLRRSAAWLATTGWGRRGIRRVAAALLDAAHSMAMRSPCVNRAAHSRRS